ncbi:MAG: hypothetical protein CTY12_06255 [Methylotenera sp.]|nr:MAG: hypothetical protein CTY12_06255 [Methylotenera sp.]
MTSKNTRDRDDDDVWDGRERRRSESDRRLYQELPPYYPQYYQAPPPPPATDQKNVALSTLTLQQFGTIVLVLGSVLFGGFNYVSNLTREIDTQRTNFEQFKSQIGKEIDNIQGSVKDLKRITDETKIHQQTSQDAIERRIQDLDTSVNQLYQKVSAK